MATTEDWRPTACILCECNCGLEVQLDGRRLARFRGDERHPSSRGYACEKPHRLDHYQNGRDRLTTPLRRTPSGDFEPIDWDTAIREVAQRLAAVRDTHGGDTIFYYGGGGQGNHLPGAYATATRRSVGCRYRSSPLAQEKTGEFWVSHRMMGVGTRADFEHCDVALFLGKNPWHSHSIPRARVTLKAIAQDPARTLIVIDPRRTETAELADIHLQVCRAPTRGSCSRSSACSARRASSTARSWTRAWRPVSSSRCSRRWPATASPSPARAPASTRRWCARPRGPWVRRARWRASKIWASR
jgi:anaerobic selenocysteine-containing dehydrogenase